MPVPRDWIVEQWGVFLTESDIEILNGSFNRSIRNDPDEEFLVKVLYLKYIGKVH